MSAMGGGNIDKHKPMGQQHKAVKINNLPPKPNQSY